MRTARRSGRPGSGYLEDLAFVHDAGFSDFAEEAASFLLERLRPRVPPGGRVVDLGCGSGTFARRLTDAGYAVAGVDQSSALLALARRRAPRASFLRASFLDVELPRCHAVTALGEVLNYQFDSRASLVALRRLFRRVHAALAPGGLFAFDLAGPGLARRGKEAGFRSGDGWDVLFEKEGRGPWIVRRIVTFRRVGRCWRRSEEVHRLRLHPAAEVRGALEREGFRVRVLRGYGERRLPRGGVAFLAEKPRRGGPPEAGGRAAVPEAPRARPRPRRGTARSSGRGSS